MAWEVARHEKRISDAPACSSCVSASTAPHLAGDDRLRGRRRSRPRERAPAVDRDGPYSRTGRSSVLPRTFGAWALYLYFLNSRQRLGQTLNLLRFRVRLSEYYNFGRIEPGRHGRLFGLENGQLRPSTIIFSRCAALMKAAPHGARGKSSLTWGAARQKPRFFTQN